MRTFIFVALALSFSSCSQGRRGRNEEKRGKRYDIIFDEDLETHECITPDGVPGKCIELIVCKPLLELLERISVDNPNFKDYLGDSTCGYIQFNPKVCCPDIGFIGQLGVEAVPVRGLPHTAPLYNSKPFPPQSFSGVDKPFQSFPITQNQPKPLPPNPISSFQTEKPFLSQSAPTQGISPLQLYASQSPQIKPISTPINSYPTPQIIPEMASLKPIPFQTPVETLSQTISPQNIQVKPIIVQSPSKPNPSPNQYELTPSMKPIPFQSLAVKPIPVKPPTNTNFPQLPLVKPQPGGPVPSKTSSFVSPASCGVSRALRTRIVGGEIAPKGAWPWIVLLGYRNQQTGKVSFICGGSLVTDQHVVTAAHCVYNKNAQALVRLGEHDTSTDSDGANPIDVEIIAQTWHEGFNSSTFRNDVAVLKLARKVPLSADIQPICLPIEPELRSKSYVGSLPFVAGWGVTTPRGNLSSVLREVQVPVVSELECRNAYSTSPAKIDENYICAGYPQGGKDACRADSGGPLMISEKNRYSLLGIVSFGRGCADPKFPGVYARVSQLIDWIVARLN